MKKAQMLILCATVPAFFALGCGAGEDQKAPDKAAFEQKAVPPEWKGPGQPGAPGSAPSGAPGGPPAGSGPIQVPPNIKGGQ